MRLLVIRHGIAVERDAARPDETRPLTDRGKRRVKRVARGLERLVPRLDVLATSPLIRARQTAEIVARRYHDLSPQLLDELAPLTPQHRLLAWLAGRDPDETVAIVGHEDGLSVFVSWLLTGRAESRLVLKKSGACLVRIAGKCEAGSGLLEWLMTPSQLAEIG